MATPFNVDLTAGTHKLTCTTARELWFN